MPTRLGDIAFRRLSLDLTTSLLCRPDLLFPIHRRHLSSLPRRDISNKLLLLILTRAFLRFGKRGVHQAGPIMKGVESRGVLLVAISFHVT